jgi:hypothetical protein
MAFKWSNTGSAAVRNEEKLYVVSQYHSTGQLLAGSEEKVVRLT